MPAVVDLLVFVGGLGQVDLDEGIGHSLSSPTQRVDKTELSIFGRLIKYEIFPLVSH
jgi:hypothetical protein